MKGFQADKGESSHPALSRWLSLPAALLFSGSVLLLSSLLGWVSTEPRVRVMVLLMPLPAFLLFVLAARRSFRAYDERQRGLLIEALTFAFILTLFALAFVGSIAGYWSAVRRQLV
jgi:hypothetical protein